MEFVVFVWLWAGVAVLAYAVACGLIRRQALSGSGYTAGLGLLTVVLCFYLPACDGLWASLGRWLNVPARPPLFRGVWQLAALFRALWPAVGAAVLGMAFGEAANPSSGVYRAMKRFHHTKIVLMCLLLGLYGLVFTLRGGKTLQIMLLNGALYTACWYWRFGFHTIAYTLQKCGVPALAGSALLTVACIASGAAFILPMVLILGIGISDIWMDYHRRGAAKLLFTLQLK